MANSFQDTAAPELFDVFLSHHSRDKDAVRVLAEKLKFEGINPWFDEWHIKPGESILAAIQLALPRCKSCAVFIGRGDNGLWHEQEMESALYHRIESGSFPVIPVFLSIPDRAMKEQLPVFLRVLKWVEFSTPDDHEAFRQLKCGIRGEEPGFMPTHPSDQGADQCNDRISPHGLRSFNEADSRFILRLLPGVRDHRGLPESIAFWKDHLEQIDPERTFGVGLLYGPSGCGKSSLVKAGLIPRLADGVRPLYLEATSGDTERQLLARLRKQVSALPADLDLPASLAFVRDHPTVLGGNKLVLILDQFEQWLHGNRINADAPLVVALRLCEGTVLQAILMVSAEFHIDVYRFMKALGTEPKPNNTAVVDFFDSTHARKILLEFGRAYDRIPSMSLNDEKEAFLDQAIEELSNAKGLLIAVDLALFAQIFSRRDWTSSGLKRIGGATGVGRMFLEENFDISTAHPAHRVYRRAAMAVLRKLLPPGISEIKGTMQPRSVLHHAADQAQPKCDFDVVMRILVSDLRLITPSAVDEPEFEDVHSTIEPSYQLTHDSLLRALREWLTAEDRRTRRGRARLLLEERTDQWMRDHNSRNLPSFSEFATIRLFVPLREWTDEQTKMMRTALLRLGTGVIIFSTLSLLTVFVLAPYLTRRRALTEHAQLMVRKSLESYNVKTDIEGTISHLKKDSALRGWAIPTLKKELLNPQDHNRKLIALWLLLEIDDRHAAPWFEPLHDENSLDNATFAKLCWSIGKRASVNVAQKELELLVKETESLDWYHDAKDQDDYDKKLKARIRYGQRRAAVASALLRHQRSIDALNALQTLDDPEAMAQFCVHCRDCGVQASDLVRALRQESTLHSNAIARDFERRPLPSSGTTHKRQFANFPLFTLLMALGNYERLDSSGLSKEDQDWLSGKLTHWFKTHESSAIHGVTGWLLRKWEDELGDITGPVEQSLATQTVPTDLNKEWFVIRVNVDQNEAAYFTFVVFEPGSLEMSSPPYEHDRVASREFRHRVRLEQRFAICDREVTCQQFDVSEHLATKENERNIPKNLSWDKSVKYCNWLTQQFFIGKTDQRCYVIRDENTDELVPDKWSFFKKAGFRLPTEAEWEYACRSGTRTPYGFGSDQNLTVHYGWIRDSVPHDVGQSRPNLRGVFDVHGNVDECCSDRYSETKYVSDEIEVNPFHFHGVVKNQDRRVFRGGGWSNNPKDVRSAVRWWDPADNTGRTYGMRLALTLDIHPSDVDK